MTDQISKPSLPTQSSYETFGTSIWEDPKTFSELANSPVFENMKKMDPAPINMATQYFDFSIGVPERFVFLGITKRAAQDTGEELPAIVILDEKKNSYINMGAILVSCFIEQKIMPGTPIQITWIGQKKTQSNGQVRTWDVRPLINAAK